MARGGREGIDVPVGGRVSVATGALREIMAELEPRPEETAEESTVTALRRAILEGVLPPGERLRQETLAAELGVSRIPLRDAFRRLEAEGLIRIDGRRGARVASLTSADVHELYELRRLIEVHCLRLAIRNLTDGGAESLLTAVAEMDVSAGHRVSHGIRGFYGELYSWSNRPRMASEILQLRHELNRYHAVKHVPLDLAIHAELAECIRTRDAERAARSLREHLRKSRDELVAALRREARVREPLPRGRRATTRRS
jgi:DNA-binding GntR family transcriptional regulator